VQNGLPGTLKKRCSRTGEPQRGHVMLLIIFILADPFAVSSDSLHRFVLFRNSLDFLESRRFLL
jgi:hypothetical protein